MTTTKFQRQLRHHLDEQRIPVRELARRVSPENPEHMRRSLHKYLSGRTLPSRLTRIAIADALGVDREPLLEDEDDKEADLATVLRAEIARILREQRTVEVVA